MGLRSRLSRKPDRRTPPLSFFFFNDTATTEIYTLSLHDALPISPTRVNSRSTTPTTARRAGTNAPICASSTHRSEDRKSTRLNSSHSQISYAVFCLKKKKNTHLLLHQRHNPSSLSLTRTK